MVNIWTTIPALAALLCMAVRVEAGMDWGEYTSTQTGGQVRTFFISIPSSFLLSVIYVPQ